ncbi:hypothetical protein Tco_0659134 [Tanacetum coccineum]
MADLWKGPGVREWSCGWVFWQCGIELAEKILMWGVGGWGVSSSEARSGAWLELVDGWGWEVGLGCWVLKGGGSEGRRV